jgi:hypothetical protein
MRRLAILLFFQFVSRFIISFLPVCCDTIFVGLEADYYASGFYIIDLEI